MTHHISGTINLTTLPNGRRFTTVKTTFKLSDDVAVRANKLAREENTTLSSLAEEGLVLLLNEREQPRPVAPPAVKPKDKASNPIYLAVLSEDLCDLVYEGRCS